MVSRAEMREFQAGRGFKGPYGDYVHLELMHLGEEKIDKKLPFVRELAKNYVGVDPVCGADPGAAGRALHDGRRRHRHERRDRAAGPVRRRRVRLRVDQRRQPAGLELAHRVPGVRRARGPRTRRSSRKGSSAGGETTALEQARSEEARLAKLRGKHGGEKIAQIRRELNHATESRLRRVPRRGVDARGRSRPSRS